MTDGLALFVGNIISGVFTIIAPWGTNFYWIGSFIFLSNVGQGFVDLCMILPSHFCAILATNNIFLYYVLDCNLSILHLWGDKSSNFMQALHMCFGIGCLLTPLITRPFYLPLVSDDNLTNSTLIDSAPAPQFSPDDVKIQYAFVIIGGYCVFVGLIFFYYFLQDNHSRSYPSQARQVESIEGKAIIPTWKKYSAVILVAIMAHIAFGVEFILGKKMIILLNYILY